MACIIYDTLALNSGVSYTIHLKKKLKMPNDINPLAEQKHIISFEM